MPTKQSYVKPIFDPMCLDLTTESEREIFNEFEQDLKTYITGTIGENKRRVDGVKIRQETSAMSVISKRQQSRSAMAMIKYDKEKRSYILTNDLHAKLATENKYPELTQVKVGKK